MAPADCIFCKIVSGEIPSDTLYEDDDIIAFSDINPLAPVHFLVVPKTHIPSLDDLTEAHSALIGKMMLVGTSLARKTGAAEAGYREVINCGAAAGQEVLHLHMHIIGGRAMRLMG